MTVDQVLDLPAWLSTPVAIVSGVLVFAFWCRVRLVTPLEHRVSVWAVHWAGLLACGWIGIAAVSGAQMHAVDIAMLTMAGAHIVGTWYSWAGGVPDHAVRARVRVGAAVTTGDSHD